MKELFQLNKPYFHITFSEKDESNHVFSHIKSIIDRDIVLRKIDGNNCSTIDTLFDEFSKVFEFPDYFGNNWPALNECLNDLDWLPGKAYLLFIHDTDKITETSDASFNTLVKLLERSVNEWTEGRNYDNFPTPPTPFHVVFQCSNEKKNQIKLRLKMTGLKNINILKFTE